ncbi:DUF2975 domain-containing protein [Companilactobacillus halodurans]|uniref:DUF2975 domain-containing protein n=1 Tax=Companilactobacillus halodurans TaxID=2584183 RepID=A0A5P0ZMG3_9LACO|nr:DUF2975 domain-containing protein [Companilactobacillus halodurans]MQS75407.1 DUF2975 domain-containing protein [Companilactobacillus halodurans]MQS97353.1 DUF2975 domain-containing protein [Companilactobacillus halodurans]
MQIKTTLLKLVTLIIDGFTLLFAFMLMMGLINSFQTHSLFKLQIMTSVFLYIACLIILFISHYLYRIFHLIDIHDFFSPKALRFVKNVRYLFTLLFLAIMGIMPFVYHSADLGDAPGLIVITLAIAFIPLAIAAFISAMEKILINSSKFKQENELTI